MARTSFNVSIDYELDYEVFENLIVTAIEGGCNYWMWVDRKLNPELRELYRTEPLSVAIAKAVFNDDITVVLTDAENDDETYELKASKVEGSIRKMIKNGYADVFRRIMSEEYDANDADIMFQYIVLGEVTFG